MAKPAKPNGEGGNVIVGANGLNKEQVDSFFRRMHNRADEHETLSADFREDMKAIFEEAEEKLGVPAKVLRLEYTGQRSKMKRAERIAKLDLSDRAKLEMLAAAFGDDTPFGRYASEMAAGSGART